MIRKHIGTAVAIVGVASLALAATLFHGPSQGVAALTGFALMFLGVWMQRRKDVDWSNVPSRDEDRMKDYLPGTIGGDPRPWLDAHGPADSDSESDH
jgi:hypothetical protein